MSQRLPCWTVQYIALIFSILIALSRALICYENDEQGHIKAVENKDWNYCMLVPKTPLNPGGGSLSGVGPLEDNTGLYDSTFDVSNPLYKILSLCILEVLFNVVKSDVFNFFLLFFFQRYDFTSLLKIRKFQPEFMFRCVCNYDKCNSEANFQNYLRAIVKNNE
ncbi:unnamed protein product [Enterobius vermicularis]|uniref:Uncharacterized protein n=1 Tax=Enterobius vermicularis TaxID=51028 RepID=A0A0N4VKX2_ENTVE|nr:unnamed protein product [Enterobius vermicularis]